MADSIERPKYSPEQINKLRASRALAGAEAIKHGAVYVDDEVVKGRLEFTKAQVASIQWGHESGTPPPLASAEVPVGRPPQSSKERLRLIGRIASR
jgi:hypothetical protein